MNEITSPNSQRAKNQEQILNAARLLFDHGQLVEVRARERNGRIVSRYFRDLDRMAAVIAKTDANEKWMAIWWTLQQLRDGAESDKKPGETTKRTDIAAYRWLPIDVDRADKDAKKLNATEGEKKELLAIAKEILAWLVAQGAPDCVLCDSGNGCHILIKLPPLPASPENYTLLKQVLVAIRNKFSPYADLAQVDTSLAEPEQIIKAYGTITRKSENAPERPWQRSGLIHVPKKVSTVKFDVLLAIAALAPLEEKSERQKYRGNTLDPNFDPWAFFDHYAGAFAIERDFEKDGKTYFVTDTCILAGHKHTGSGQTGFVLGDSFGYHCFSSDCEGLDIGDVLRKLKEEHGPYSKPIWRSFDSKPGRELVDWVSTESMDETSNSVEAPAEAAETALNVPSPTADVAGVGPAAMEAPQIVRRNDLLATVFGVIFRDPKSAHSDFVVWRNRLEWIVDERAWPKVQLPLLEKLMGYEREHHRLPTRDEFKASCGPELGAEIDGIGKLEAEITLDHAVGSLLNRAEYLDEQRTINRAGELLKNEGISSARKYQRERWSRAVSVENTRVDGSIQDHAEEIFNRMASMGQGLQAESQLAFLTPFPSINEAILSDQERCFAIIGPPNNFKTSVLLSQAYFLAKQGKPTLFVTGEHEVERLEEKLTLLHGFFHRDRFALPAYKDWADGKVSPKDVNNLRTVMDDWKSMRGVPGSLVVKHISDFGNDLERIVSWMESSHRKYGWKALFIDPFMELLLNVEDQQKFSVSGGVCQELLALKTGYRNGEGLIIATSLQMKKAVKGKISQLHRDRLTTLHDYERVLEASEIERYSGAVQRFDMLWGVAAADDRGNRGVMVCSRTRHGRGFDPFYFFIDPASHFCFEPAPEPKFEAEALIEAIQ